MKDDDKLNTANALMRAVKQNTLQKLREYGLYENAGMQFSDTDVGSAITLTQKVRTILEKSRDGVSNEPMQLAGINMPDNQILPMDENPRALE